MLLTVARTQIKAEHPDMKPTEVTAEISRRWAEVPKDPRVAAADKVMVYLTIGLIGGCFYDRPEYYVCVAMIAMVHDSINHTDRIPEKALRHAGMHVVANLSALYMLTLPLSPALLVSTRSAQQNTTPLRIAVNTHRKRLIPRIQKK